MQGRIPDRSILLLQRTFSLCVKQTHLDGCKDAIRSARKENNYFFLSFIRKQLLYDFGVMLQQQPFAISLFLVPSLFVISNYFQG